MTQHELTIQKIRAYWRKRFGVELSSRELRKTVWRAYRARVVDELGRTEKAARNGFEQDFPTLGFRPDLYSVQRRGRQIIITAIEVEDTSRITSLKLEALACCWFYADCSEFLEFRCWVCDRYGNNWHRLDLATAYLEIEDEEAEEA